MIKLLTGQPGHGKTALALHLAMKLRDEGRLIYAHGIPSLDYDKIGFKRLDDPTKWQDLPDGSVVVIDECYSTFPSRAPGKAVPDHVEKMATHRHRGFDFLLIAQQGLQLDSFLRGLVEEHIHVRRKWGTKATKLKRWSQYQNNVQGHCADVDDWIRPKHVFDYYTSTVMDTSKVHIPKWVRMLAIGLVVLVGLVWLLKHRWEEKIDTLQSQAHGAAAVDGGGTTTAAGVRVSYATAKDYASALLPRIEKLPQSAPLYDGRPVQQVPQVVCMASGLDGSESCTCLTQQGTKWNMSQSACRDLARNGPPFDPFRQPDREASHRAADAASTTSHNGELRPASGLESTEQQTRYGGFRSMAGPD